MVCLIWLCLALEFPREMESLPVNIAAIEATPNAIYHDMLMFECVSLQVSLKMNHLFSENMVP